MKDNDLAIYQNKSGAIDLKSIMQELHNRLHFILDEGVKHE